MPLAARPVEIAIFAIAALSIEFRPISPVAREARTIPAIHARSIFPLSPRLHLAAVAVSKISIAITAAKFLARPISELAVGELPLGPAVSALATRCAIVALEFRTIAAIELRPVTTRLEVSPLAAPPVIPIKPGPVAELAIGEAPFRAFTARRAVAALEFWTIPSRLEIPLLTAPAIIPVEARRTRPVAIVAARPIIITVACRAALAVAAKAALAAVALVEVAFAEFLVPTKAAGAALAARGAITPAARGIVVFVAVTGHERSHFDGSNGGGRARHEALPYAKPESTFAEGPSSNRFPLAIRGMNAPSFMDLALKTAENAGKSGEVPIGCVIVRDYQVIATASNRTLTDRDPTAHAEILAIREAAEAIGTERLVDCDLYVTLEPCTMCAAAISFARIRRLYYGAADPKGGAVDSGVRFFASPTCHHAPEVYSAVGETEAATLLKEFFRVRR